MHIGSWGICTISTGCVNGVIADPKLIFVLAIKKNACTVVLAHNHPSGSLKPSENDRQLTWKMKEAGRILEITVLDHIIVSDEGYYSFADDGVL